MLETDKVALHYKVIANTAHKIEHVAKELSELYKADWFEISRVELRKKHFTKYVEELKQLVNSED